MAQKLEVRIVKVEDQCKSIWDKLLEMNERMVGMDHAIRGNGKPGLVADLKVQAEKIKTLEGTKKDWKDFVAMGVSGGLVALFTAFVQHFIK